MNKIEEKESIEIIFFLFSVQLPLQHFCDEAR